MPKKKKAYLDVCISICPYCETVYADASWYMIGLESDINCGECGNSYNPKTSKVNRFVLEFLLDAYSNVIQVKKKEDIIGGS